VSDNEQKIVCCLMYVCFVCGSRGGVQINYLIILGARLIAFSELRKAELKEREREREREVVIRMFCLGG